MAARGLPRLRARAALRLAFAVATAASIGGVFGGGGSAVALATCTISWDGGGGTSSWHTAANWTPERVPTTTDHVCIPDMTPNVTVTVTTGTTSILSIQADEPLSVIAGTLNVTDAANASELRASLSITGGSMAISSPATVATLTQNGGTLGGSATVTVTGAHTFTNGIQNGPGSTTIAPGATWTLNGGDGGTGIHNGRVMTNNGTANWTGGWMYTGQGATSSLINNGTMTLSSTGGLYAAYCCGGGVFTNTGTLTKTGAAAASFTVSNQNDGAVSVNGGSLHFNGGTGTSDGSYTVASGTMLEITGATHSLSAASSVTGAGTLRLSGTATIAGAVDVGALSITAGTNTLSAAPTVNSVSVTGGTTTFNTSFSTPTLTQNGGTIGGSATITVTGAHTFTNGTQNGPGSTIIAPGATWTLNGGDGWTGIHFGRVMTNNGTANWTGGWMYTGQGATSPLINNGTMAISGTGGLYAAYCCGGGIFTNTGTLTKTGAAAASFTVSSQNDGTVSVNGGTLQFNGGTGTSDGSYTIAAGTTLEMSGATHTLSAASSVTGAGTFRIAGNTSVAGTVDVGTLSITGGTNTFSGVAPQNGGLSVTGGSTSFNASFTAPTFTQNGGTIGGSATITVTGAHTFTNGTQNGPGSTIIAPGATWTINGGDGWTSIHNGRVVTNNGTANWTGGWMYTGLGATSSLINNGTMTISNTGGLYAAYCCGGGIFTNTGTLTKTGTASASFTASSQNDGTVAVNGGTLQFNGGTGTSDGSYTVVAGAVLELAGNTHTLSAAATVTGAGALRIAGNTTSNATIELGTVSVTNGSNTIAGAPLQISTLSISGGTTSFNTSFTVPTFIQNGGTLGGSAQITVTGTHTFTSGTQNGPGSTTIAPGATWTLNGGDGWTGIHFGRVMTNNGTANWTGGWMYTGQGATSSLINNGTMAISGTGGLYAAYCCGGGVFTNTGTVTKTGTGTAPFNVTVTNTGGVFRAHGGRLELNTLANYSTTTRTLTGGTYDVRATLMIANADVVTNAASITLDGPAARIVDQSNNDGLRSLTTNAAAGSLTVTNGANLVWSRTITNRGALSIGANSTVLTTGVTQPEGSTTLTATTSRLGASTGTVAINGGTLSGIGSVSPNVTSSATVSPGLSPGMLDVEGNYTQTSAGVLPIEIGAPHDRLMVGGTATLDGTLALSTVGGFDPAEGDTFEIVSAGSVTGAFATIDGQDIGNGLFYDVVYDADSATVVVRRPGLSVADVTVTEGTSETEPATPTTATFAVSLAPAPRTAVTVAYATADGTAGAPGDYATATGILTFAPGETLQTVDVDVVADAGDEGDETFTLTLSAPVDATISDGSAVATIVDDDGVPSISVADAEVIEGDAGSDVATFVVGLSAPSGVAVSAAWTTTDVTATAGEDYTAASGTVAFAPGETTQTIAVAVTGDAVDERDETFRVALSNLSGADVADGEATGTIVDDDGEPVVSISDVRVGEPDDGTTPARFVVSLSAPSGLPVDVAYATENGTARAPADYTAAAGNVRFAPGQTSKTLEIAVAGDTLDEADETFTLRLTAAADAVLGDDTGEATIVDDDAAPAVTISDASVTEGDDGSAPATFDLALSTASGLPVTVTYATADGSAHAPADYTAASGSVTFAPGETAKTISVAVQADQVDEPAETFSVQIAGAPISDGAGLATIVDDDPDCTIIGSPRADVLVGTDGDDVICGLGGDDIVVGAGGNDILVGGDGDDVLQGGLGDDLLQGDAGNDRLSGGAGADVARGGGGDDDITVLDAAADDTADGGAGTDECRTDEGDTVTGCP